MPLSRGLAPQTVQVRHGDAAGNAADDADEALVGAADKKVFEVRPAVELFFRRAVHRPVVVSGVAHDRGRRKHVGVDNVATVVGHKPNGRLGDAIIPS